jgi:hypothetical protein
MRLGRIETLAEVECDVCGLRRLCARFWVLRSDVVDICAECLAEALSCIGSGS